MPAPASTPNMKTTTQIATRAGRLDAGHSLPNGLALRLRIMPRRERACCVRPREPGLAGRLDVRARQRRSCARRIATFVDRGNPVTPTVSYRRRVLALGRAHPCHSPRSAKAFECENCARITKRAGRVGSLDAARATERMLSEVHQPAGGAHLKLTSTVSKFSHWRHSKVRRS
jgi:hypothetical protein